MHSALMLDDELGRIASSRVVHRLGEQSNLLEEDGRALGAEIFQRGVVIDFITPDLSLQISQEGIIPLSFSWSDERP